MANLRVKIVLRLPASAGRGWIVANGKNDPPGTFHLRYYSGKTMKHVRIVGDYHDAEIALLLKERELLASSQGFVLPIEETPANVKKFHRCSDVIESYIQMLRATTKRNGRKYSARNLKSLRAELVAFVQSSDRTHVEQFSRADILAFKERLYTAGKASDTVVKKMLIAVSWLKRNPILSLTGLLKPEDWPMRRKTKAHPYSEAEIRAMLAAARTYEETLLMRVLFATGMRKGEVQQLEFEDLDSLACCVRVRNKPLMGWQTKTVAGVREIPMDDELIAELRTLGKTGLIWRSKATGRVARIERTLEQIGKRAGVLPPVDDRASWCRGACDSERSASVHICENSGGIIFSGIGGMIAGVPTSSSCRKTARTSS